jgi:hypothetical protein
MAEVITPDYSASLGGGGRGSVPVHGGPRIEMVRNADFSFPRKPQDGLLARREEDDSTRRPSSMHISLPPSSGFVNAHKRATSTLPNFTFNSGDTTGLQETPPKTPTSDDENAPVTPSRRGHRRGGSEFVGGDSRFGVSNALSSSPTKTTTLPLPPSGPPPGARRGHAHRRSAAMSSHDVSNIMQPSEALPRLSHSLPNTPMEHPAVSPPLDRSTSAPNVNEPASDPFGPPLDNEPTRPPSRPRVGFDDNVTIIPRPLSTISSETESSISTRFGHSYDNSISSVISMSTPSPPAARMPRPPPEQSIDEDTKPRAKSSLEISRRIEKEGEWLKSRSSGSLKRRRADEPVPTQVTTFVEPEIPERPRQNHKKHSISHALGFDRRRSEPTIGLGSNEPSRLSALSLQESTTLPATLSSQSERDCESVSSARKIKQWAAAKITRRSKSPSKPLSTRSSGSSMRPVSEGSMFVPGKVPVSESPVAETDLDAVFHSEGMASTNERPISSSQERTDASALESTQPSFLYSQGADEMSPMLDLDAALGPFKTPPIGSQRQRKELHSNRLNRDFIGPGGHYHRRTESAPTLPPMDGARLGTPSHASMDDVFEEEEEEDATSVPPPRPASIAASAKSGAEDETNVGVEIVDQDSGLQSHQRPHSARGGLGIQHREWEPERPATSYGNVNSRFSTSVLEPRGSSIMEETIEEESSPVEAVEIVEAHEEPRASSLTKSSDSSETPTILAPPATTIQFPYGPHTLVTPETAQSSVFPSPDFAQRQASFDGSRLGTSASSMTDNRTMSSYATGDQGPDLRPSVDDVPSLTSSRSTMLSTAQANNSRRDISNGSRLPPATPRSGPSVDAADRRRKRSSIQSLSQLMGGRGTKGKSSEESRPHTAITPTASKGPKKSKENRLKKLMFWRSKQHSK